MNPNVNNPFEDELDLIRIKLYEHTKDMTSKERTEHVNRRAREIINMHGLTDVKIMGATTVGDAPVPQP